MPADAVAQAEAIEALWRSLMSPKGYVWLCQHQPLPQHLRTYQPQSLGDFIGNSNPGTEIDWYALLTMNLRERPEFRLHSCLESKNGKVT